MAFDDITLARVERELDAYLERKHRGRDLSRLRLEYRVEGQAVTLFEVRPHWRDPDESIETPVARVRWVKRNRLWKLYWMRADLKWHSYEPCPEVDTLAEALDEVDRDDYACFFG